MAVTAEQLAAELNALEQAAGRVGALLQQAPEELVEQALEGWAPAPPKCRIRATWNGYWLGWLDTCAAQWPACANRADTNEPPETEANWTGNWPQSFSDDVVESAVSDAQTPDSSVSETHLRPETGLQNGSAHRCSASSEAAEDALWAWVLGGVQCRSGSGVD